MKSFEMQPTTENVIGTFLSDSIDRDADVIRFVTILNSMEDSCSIALDGSWGSGKTFFVKQVKMILDTYNNFTATSEVKDSAEILKQTVCHINKVDPDFRPQVSVYYDSWANDNDEDPILSLVYAISQSVDLEFGHDKRVEFSKILVGIAEFFTGRRIDTIVDAFKNYDSLSGIKESKNIHSLVEEFLESLLPEKGDRLVVFIDELDRCKPSYAVQLLERIKHYFSNDRITFVFSVNLYELQHTIKHYYGNDFNACGYLDRFIDLRMSLPAANMNKYFESLEFLKTAYHFDTVMATVIDVYHFELREIAKYVMLARIAAYKPTHEKVPVDITTSLCLCLIVPILIGLRISDITRYKSFISGNDFTPLVEILNNSDIGDSIYKNLLNHNETYLNNLSDKNTVLKEDKLKSIYEAIFVCKYQGAEYEKEIGKYTFNKSTKLEIERAVGLLSEYADFDI